MRNIFVGEKPSKLAYERGITWQSAGLAGKTLHDALVAAKIDPTQQGYVNLFGTKPDDTEVVHDAGIIMALKAASDAGVRIVGMGKKVQHWLRVFDVPFTPMIHPAARGKIRGKDIYQKHVKDTLT